MGLSDLVNVRWSRQEIDQWNTIFKNFILMWKSRLNLIFMFNRSFFPVLFSASYISEASLTAK